LINTCYNTLKDPVLRAKLLLKMLGARADDDEERTVHDPEMLMEMMEVRELVQDSTDKEELGKLWQENDDKLQQSKAEISRALSAKDGPAAVKAVHRLTYLYKIGEEIENKL